MSIIVRGFQNDTILTRGFTAQRIRDKIIAIFLDSKINSVVNMIGRFC